MSKKILLLYNGSLGPTNQQMIPRYTTHVKEEEHYKISQSAYKVIQPMLLLINCEVRTGKYSYRGFEVRTERIFYGRFN